MKSYLVVTHFILCQQYERGFLEVVTLVLMVRVLSLSAADFEYFVFTPSKVMQ